VSKFPDSQQYKSRSSFAKASSWSIGGKILARLFDLISLIILSRLLDPTSFGLVAKAMTIIVILETITSVSVAQPILRIMTPTKAVYDTAFTLTFIRSLVIVLLVGLLAFPAASYFQEPQLPALLFALSLAPILRGTKSPYMIIFLRNYNLRPEFISDIVSKAFSLFLVSTIAMLTGSYWAIAAGTITTAAVLNLASYYYAPYRPRLSLLHWKDFIDVVGWGTLSQIMQTMNWQIDRIILGRLLPTDLFGQYAVASNLNEIPQQTVSVPLVRPMMVSFSAAQDSAILSSLWIKSANTSLFVAAPIMVGLAILSDAAVYVILGPQWTDASMLLMGLALAILPDLPSAPLAPLAVACFRARMYTLRVALQLVLTLPVMAISAYYYGALGAIAAKALSSFVMYLATLFIVRSLIQLSVIKQLAGIARTVAGLLVMAGVLYLSKSYILPNQETGWALLVLKALSIFCLGWLAFFATCCGLWLVAGKPQSIEAKLLKYFGVKS
jgi:O-antigen/teichoic acid export membrane protein